MTAEAAPVLDSRAWDDLRARLRAFVGRRIADRDAAEDVAQEVLLRLHRNFGALRAEDRLDAFAYRIARNAITDHYRAAARARELPAAPEAVADRAGADEGAQGDARQELARCLEPVVQRLAEPYREALLLTDLGDLSQTDAARVAGMSVPGMKSRVQRARAQLHEQLTRCCTVALDAGSRIADVEQTGPCACRDASVPG